MSEKFRIWVVSENQERLDHLSSILLEDGHTLFESSEVTGFLEHFTAQKSDLVLLDYSTNPGKAITLMENLRNSQHCCSTPILAVTDVDDLTVTLDLFEFGATDFISEPFESFELRARVNNNLNQYRKTAGNSESELLVKLSKQIKSFDLIDKIDLIRNELTQGSGALLDIYDSLRQTVENSTDEEARKKILSTISEAEFSLQFTDKVAQQVNEIGKLIYHVHQFIDDHENYTRQEADALEQSSSYSVLEEKDEKSTNNLLDSLGL